MKTAKNHPIKKLELVEIAERLFLAQGYAETSVDDILRAAGISKGGFYHYFSSKEEVLSESIDHLMEAARAELETLIDDPALNALEKLGRFLEKRRALQQPKRELARYMGVLMKSDVALYKYYACLSQKFVDPLARIIEQGQQEGRFRVAHPHETADILLRAVTSLPQSPFFQTYLEDEASADRYRAALEAVITRTLGIESQTLPIATGGSQ